MTRKQAIILVIVLFCAFLFLPAVGPHTWGYWNFGPSAALFVLLVLLLVL